MKPKTIPVISLISLDFDNIARMSDNEVWKHLVRICRVSSRRIVPARVKYDNARVSRDAGRVTVHLMVGDKDTARVNFIPAPPFNQIH